jgi:LmbE family N-acetylglucosaminyl deacetylase
MQINPSLAEFSSLAPVKAARSVSSFGPTLVVAPHPDDETLGCGGTIALLRQQRLPVSVLVITDGAASHRHSLRYPPPRLRRVHEQETLTALDRLGVLPPSVKFLGLPDGAAPTLGEPAFAAAIDRCADYLLTVQPSTILLPWRRDPHADHRAAWELVSAAAIRTGLQSRWLEYPIWLWDENQAHADYAPGARETHWWRLDITAVNALKQSAIAAYRSQTTKLIDDDPDGFCLSQRMLNYFNQPWELYLESGDGL